jgi:hypothetical protein
VTGGGGNVAQQVDQPVDGVVVVLDGGAFAVGEWDLDEHALQAGLGLEELRLGAGFGEVDVAARAGHAVRALLEEAVAAVAVAEVLELERLAAAGVAGADNVAVEEHLDRAQDTLEVAGVGVGLRERGWG